MKITRSVVARRTGYSKTSIVRFERLGLIRPTIDPKTGHRHFEEGEIIRFIEELRRTKVRIPEMTEGELSAEVFRRIELGETIIDIVRATKLQPERVEELWRYYKQPRFEDRERERKRLEDEERVAQEEKDFNATMQSFSKRIAK